MHFSSSTVGDAGSLVIGFQASQSEFSSLISDWLELWYIVTLVCVEQASRLRFDSAYGWYERSKKVKLCRCERERLRTSNYLFLNAKLIFVCSKYFLICETNVFPQNSVHAHAKCSFVRSNCYLARAEL